MEEKPRIKMTLDLPSFMRWPYLAKGVLSVTSLAHNTLVLQFPRKIIITPLRYIQNYKVVEAKKMKLITDVRESFKPSHLLLKCEGLVGNFFASSIPLTLRSTPRDLTTTQ